MPKRALLEAALPSERAKQRRQLGSLQQLTVQPATKRRYQLATDQFLQFLKKEGKVLPSRRELLDPLVCEYVEYLWSSGAGRALACDTLAGLQDMQPGLKSHLPGAWRLLRTWSVNEIPNRAPPLPEQVLQAMVGWAFNKKYYSFGVSLVIGFYTMLRSGEILAIRSSHLMVNAKDKQVLISLGLTKGGKRQGASESVILGVDFAVRLVEQWKKIAKPVAPLVRSAHQWRALFAEGLSSLGLAAFEFRPYSLRRGGATWWFQRHHSLDRILVQGRWQAQKTARIYINEGLAVLASMQIRPNDRNLVPFVNMFHHESRNPRFATLEPPPKSGSAGGRGKSARKQTKKSKRRPKTAFSQMVFPEICHPIGRQEAWLDAF